MSTSFQFTSAGKGQSVISLGRSATESDKPQEFVEGSTVRIRQNVVIDSEVSDDLIFSQRDGQIFRADEARHVDIGEKGATTKQQLEKRRATKSNV